MPPGDSIANELNTKKKQYQYITAHPRFGQTRFNENSTVGPAAAVESTGVVFLSEKTPTPTSTLLTPSRSPTPFDADAI